MTEPNKRILLAEDEPTSARLLTKVLTMEGYEVTHVRDGRQALIELASTEYAAAILDWMMPKLNGIAVIKEAHKTIKPCPPLILCTQIDTAEGRKAALQKFTSSK